METKKFEIADYLDSDKMILEYLKCILEEGDNKNTIIALGHIEKAIKMRDLAGKQQISKSSLQD